MVVVILAEDQVSESDWFRSKEASAYLATLGCFVSHRTLDNMRAKNNAGGGPSFIRTGWSTIRYHKTDLDLWAKKQTVRVE